MAAASAGIGIIGGYRPERLPAPRDYYARIFGGATRNFRPSHKGWTQVSCCFHGRDRHPSLCVNVQTGGFYCFSCGAKGGGLIDFVILRDGCDFKKAALQLGAWENSDHGTPQRAEYERRIAERKRQHERLEAAAQKLAALEHETWVQCRDRILDCERVLAMPGAWDDRQWQRAQAACALRDEYVLPAYTLLSFAAPEERARYVLHPEIQAQMAAAVRWAGYVLTADARRVEVLQ